MRARLACGGGRPLVYIASPATALFERGEGAYAVALSLAAARVVQRWFPRFGVYAAVASGAHDMSRFALTSGSSMARWRAYHLPALWRAFAVVVAGDAAFVSTSRGVREEVAFARARGVPIWRLLLSLFPIQPEEASPWSSA